MTSGGDRIFPKGLTVGTVMKVSPGADLFLNIRLKPAANLNRLEEVLVITKKEERAPSIAETGRVRAVDILAQRLPSVPDKPAAEATKRAEQPTQRAPAAGNVQQQSFCECSVRRQAAFQPASRRDERNRVKPVTPAGRGSGAEESARTAGRQPAASRSPSHRRDQPH